MPIIGKNGFIFLDDDSNDVISQITGKLALSPLQICQWVDTINKRLHHAKNHKYIYKLVIIPNKHCVYSEFLPDGYNLSNNRAALQLLKILNEEYVYPLDLFLLNKDYLIYHKTDTHWNELGAVIFFNDFLSKLSNISLDYEISEIDIIGDLGKRFKPPLHSATNKINYKKNVKLIYDNGLLNTGRLRIFENNNTNLPVGLLFGDSFFTDMSNIIAEYFSKLYYMHGPIYDESLIEFLHPDIVINQHIERFLSTPKQLSYKDILDAKIYNDNFKIKNEIININYNDNPLDIIDFTHYKEYINKILTKVNDNDFKLKYYSFISNNNLFNKINFVNRTFSGFYYHANSTNNFCSWGIGCVSNEPIKPKGISFYLDNIYQNTLFEINIFNTFCNSNEFMLDDNKLVYSNQYTIEELNIFSTQQEVFFPTPGLFLNSHIFYIITITGDNILGCGQSLRNIPEAARFLRGYFKQKIRFFSFQ